jgi:hypothetical protein
MSYWGVLDLKITGLEAEMQRLLAQIERKEDEKGDWLVLRFEDPERDITHWNVVEAGTPRHEGDSLILQLSSKWGVRWRLVDLLAEQFPKLTVVGEGYMPSEPDGGDQDWFRCRSGKVVWGAAAMPLPKSTDAAKQ